MDGSFEELRMYILESLKGLKEDYAKLSERIEEIQKTLRIIEVDISNWKGRMIVLTSAIAITVSIIVPIIIEKLWR